MFKFDFCNNHDLYRTFVFQACKWMFVGRFFCLAGWFQLLPWRVEISEGEAVGIGWVKRSRYPSSYHKPLLVVFITATTISITFYCKTTTFCPSLSHCFAVKEREGKNDFLLSAIFWKLNSFRKLVG